VSLALDTDVLVHWAMTGMPRHVAARELVRAEISAGRSVALALQVLWEFLHVVTDPRRFSTPMTTSSALATTGALWDAPDTTRIVAGPRTAHRTLELLRTLELGRERILDTALAATLEEAGIKRLATFNRKDFEAFPFLEIVEP
jgi:predicted nucleic acid-binding protein